ncbi:astacin [Teladorsagia circumcincta]|uniref:Metalloendopeptidase n=1 Tax=Teladorsagia circumcincta TaxID=45464 RepID=A0A2G9TRZ9_TELCI|nr:astacin [Teladorsagia circumcincta]
MNWNAWPSVLWVEGVNYYFDSSIPAQTKHAFLDAAKQWESHTCINFTENPTAFDRVKVSSLSGCYSHVGRIGGEQVLSLGNGCGASYIAAHEIGHLLGFIHTHSRYDRDNFVKVVWKYIEPGHNGDYGKYIPKTNDNFGLLYDYGSIMHYAAAE